MLDMSANLSEVAVEDNHCRFRKPANGVTEKGLSFHVSDVQCQLDMVICSHCNKAVPWNALSCGHCGTALSPAEQRRPHEENNGIAYSSFADLSLTVAQVAVGFAAVFSAIGALMALMDLDFISAAGGMGVFFVMAALFVTFKRIEQLVIDSKMTTRFTLVLLLALADSAQGAQPPMMLFQAGGVHDLGAAGGARTAFSIMRLPQGRFAFYDRYAPKNGPLSLPDADGNRHLLLPHLPKNVLASEVIMKSDVLKNTQVVLSRDGEVKSVRVKNEALDKETAKRVGLFRYLNTWINRVGPAGANNPLMTWRGYNGSQMEYQELRNGRLLVPHGSLIPHTRAVPPTGRHETVIQYSDDGGATWNLSESKLIAPCYLGFNGSNEGACEPAFEELKDGRIWMLMRTTAGFLYESFSSDQGTTWTPARASRFNTSTGPPNIMRHSNGWLVVCWNNCEMPPRADGVGVYGGRDALHIAVSDDEGKTWRGFREIYLDHRRDGNPAKSGDRGTAYPLGAYTSDGRIVVLAGQGKGGRNPILIDPEWIVKSQAGDDFSDGLKRWSVYTHHGPAKRWWRARAPGATLAGHPDDKTRKCLHVRKQPNLPADGATWNFPNGWRGSLDVRVNLRIGSQGAMIALNDRMFDPANDLGEDLSVFRVSLSDLNLAPDRWHRLRFEWNLSTGHCLLKTGDAKPIKLPLRHPTLNGLSYLRFRSTAKDADPIGVLVDEVKVTISDSSAPPCSPQEQMAHERRYVDTVIPGWQLQQ